jgi:LmbE family N-acetylglucosaminyl deacetylase/CheY-like chemotaxis protein
MMSSGVPGAGRILLVEDDPITARFTSHVLANRGGFEVRHAAEPGEALVLAEAEIWDLVLTDVEMPGMTGIELLTELRKVSPHLPVVVVTAFPSFDRAVQALRSQADEFLEKPVPPDKLIETASTLVAKGRAARQANHRSVLAVGAHPDDVEIGAAGALLLHRAAGDTVTILTLCRGARGGRQDTRAEEAQRAADIIGATLYLDDLPDTKISEGDPTIGVIAGLVEQVQPNVIYTHSLHDVHQDHRNTHRAAMVAVRGIGRVYCWQSPSATVDFRPSRFVAIDEQVERKLAAIGQFGSQVEIRTYLAPDLISATARYWSRFGDGRYAEAFEVIREAAEPAGLITTAAAAVPRPAETGAQAGRQSSQDTPGERGGRAPQRVPQARAATGVRHAL